MGSTLVSIDPFACFCISLSNIRRVDGAGSSKKSLANPAPILR